jgi:DNA damage-binding protein 1
MEIEEEDQDEVGGALAEVTIPGFNSSKLTLFAGNVLVGKFDLLLQVVEDDVRLIDSETLASIAHWSPLSDSDACGDDDDDDDDEPAGFITVASANQCGQIIVALRGGVLVYLLIEGEDIPTIRRVRKVTLDREISCVDLNPFGSSSSPSPSSLIGNNNDTMDVDVAPQTRKSQLVAVGLWDDFSVRLLNLVGDPSSFLEQVLHINLGRGGGIDGMSRLSSLDSDERNGGVDGGQHMMARSLCLVTLDSHATTSHSSINKNTSPAASGHSVDMLLVGLGDGKLISFVVNQTGLPSKSGWSIHSRKEVSLGTQGVHLIPFHHGSSKSSGSCVLATGDRPTIVYLTGGNAGSNSNPKLNYSTISLTVDGDDDDVGHASHKNISVNVAVPFRSSLLFSMSSANGSSICVADDSTLRLGMIDNIQKLHVTSFKLGMTPRRIAYHEAGRVYCVGCIADLEQGGEANQNNCIRFFDDSTFEELNW